MELRLKRRTFLQTSAIAPLVAGLARPNVARGAGNKVLKFIPQSDVTVLDPVWTTAYVTRNHGMTVFDTLFATDSKFQPQPQMCDGVQTGNEWRLTLRDGLKFHDGTPVLAKDCVASVQRMA